MSHDDPLEPDDDLDDDLDERDYDEDDEIPEPTVTPRFESSSRAARSAP